MALNCVDTTFFGQVCDACDGGAVYKIIAHIIKILTLIIGPLAVIGIIIVGIMYITSSGDPARQTKAKRKLIAITIGIGCFAVLFAFANFLIPGGVISSTLDETTSSCPGESQNDKQSNDFRGGKQFGSSSSLAANSYPAATVEGKDSSGTIRCPRNADYIYSANPAGKEGSFDRWFQSVAQNCPFTTVIYADDADDEACAPGGTMHVKDNWCIVNSKVDAFEYQTYLSKNHIGQDGRTCLTDGSECSNAEGLSDWGASYYFAATFALNLNNGEVVSNDAYAARLGIAFDSASYGYTQYGTREATWGGTEISVYDDGLAGVTINSAASQPTPHAPSVNSMSDILKELRAGHAVTIGVHSIKTDSDSEKNCGHYMTAIGYTNSCANGIMCSSDDLIVLNTNGKISTLGSSNYRLGYRRACTGL